MLRRAELGELERQAIGWFAGSCSVMSDNVIAAVVFIGIGIVTLAVSIALLLLWERNPTLDRMTRIAVCHL